jgi:hypothetical protein
VYIQDEAGHYGFRHTRPPIVEQLHNLLQRISQRVARFLERDEDSSYLTLDRLEEDPLQDIHRHSVAYHIAVGPQKSRKVFAQVHFQAHLLERPGS